MARPSILGVKTEDSGIYLIKNVVDGKVYVGSAKRLIERISLHKHLLRNNHHSIHLQRAWNKYGENVFIFGVLEIIENNQDLIVVEQKYINKYESYNDKFGYNICPLAKNNLGSKHQRGKKEKSVRMSGEGNNFYNKKHTKEARRLIGLHNHKRRLTNEQIDDIKYLWNGRFYSQKDIAYVYKVSPSHISKIVNNNSRIKI